MQRPIPDNGNKGMPGIYLALQIVHDGAQDEQEDENNEPAPSWPFLTLIPLQKLVPKGFSEGADYSQRQPINQKTYKTRAQPLIRVRHKLCSTRFLQPKKEGRRSPEQDDTPSDDKNPLASPP